MDNPFEKPLGLPKFEEVKNEEPIVETTQVVEEEKKIQPIMSTKNKILQAHGGNESDVPINSPYWKMKH